MHLVSLLLVFVMNLKGSNQRDQKDDQYYYFEFHKIDNQVDILVNDSLIYSSGVIDFNPDLKNYRIKIGDFLTEKKDKVELRLYNGRPPYTEQQDDSNWEVFYELMHNETEISQVWEFGDDKKVGLVFEKVYFF